MARKGEFNSEEDYIYYCGQESLRRNGVALIINKSLKCHTTCLLRNWYTGQEATVITGHEKMDWFQTGKGVRQRVHQGCILSPCLYNLYAEYIMWNARLNEAHSGMKIAGRNIYNLRYADDTTLMAESEEELKSLLMEVKVQFSSVTQSCPTLYDPMNSSTPGLLVNHQFPEFTQTHVHRVSDAIQPSHPQSSPSPPALNLSQHQDLFQWVSSLNQVAKVLEFQLQHQSFWWTPRTDLL